MSSAGHVLDMIKRMQQNRANRASNKNKFKGNSSDFDTSVSGSKPLKFKEVPQEELEEIKLKIRAKAEADKKLERIIYLSFGAIALVAIIAVIVWVI